MTLTIRAIIGRGAMAGFAMFALLLCLHKVSVTDWWLIPIFMLAAMITLFIMALFLDA